MPPELSSLSYFLLSGECLCGSVLGLQPVIGRGLLSCSQSSASVSPSGSSGPGPEAALWSALWIFSAALQLKSPGLCLPSRPQSSNAASDLYTMWLLGCFYSWLAFSLGPGCPFCLPRLPSLNCLEALSLSPSLLVLYEAHHLLVCTLLSPSHFPNSDIFWGQEMSLNGRRACREATL